MGQSTPRVDVAAQLVDVFDPSPCCGAWLLIVAETGPRPIAEGCPRSAAHAGEPGQVLDDGGADGGRDDTARPPRGLAPCHMLSIITSQSAGESHGCSTSTDNPVRHGPVFGPASDVFRRGHASPKLTAQALSSCACLSSCRTPTYLSLRCCAVGVAHVECCELAWRQAYRPSPRPCPARRVRSRAGALGAVRGFRPDRQRNRLMAELATVALANFDARVRFETRSARGNPKRALALLDKLDRAG